MTSSPYTQQPPRAFWRKSVADVGALGYSDLWQPSLKIDQDSTFATFGSCFAQHFSRALVARGLGWVNAEPAPGRTPDNLARRFNYGIYSARTANIYTGAHLREWVTLSLTPEACADVELWEEQGRYRDALRPNIEPDGFANAAEARASLETAARAFRNAVESANVFVFTMGLTEGWEHSQTGQVYAMCPGTLGGAFDADCHVLRNYSYPETRCDLETSIAGLKQLNPDLQILLTVSPVPLTATATPEHVLLATTYSKAVLRTVAGDLARESDDVDYFPSYEIIAAPPSRGMFFEPNQRSVSPLGVDFVMGHFFGALGLEASSAPPAEKPAHVREDEQKMAQEELKCEEMILESYGKA